MGIYRHPPTPPLQPGHKLVFPGTSFSQTIEPGGILSALAFGVPLVAPGAILVNAGIPSAVAFGNPFLNQTQTVIPELVSGSPATEGGIPSALAFGVPQVYFVEIIEPLISVSPNTAGGIPSALAFGTPALVGGPRYLTFQGIPSATQFGTPSLTGGTGLPALYIAGVNVSQYWCPQGAGSNAAASTITSQAIGRATLTLDMFVGDGSGYVPLVGQTIRVQDQGVTVFAGCIDTVAADWENSGVSPTVVVFHITALDKTSICDRRIVTQAPGNPYLTGADVVGVILDICTNYLNGEGIGTGDLPPAGSLGALTANLPLNYCTVTDAFNQIATLSGTVWWIDFFSNLHFSSFSELPEAPFSLTESAGTFRNAIGYTSLSGNGVTGGYANTIYVVTNLNVLPGSGTSGSGGSSPGASGVTENYTWEQGNQGINILPNGSEYLTVNLPVGSVISMTVNGVPQTVLSFDQVDGQISTGPDDFGWIYVPGYNQVTPTLYPIPTGAVIVIEYVPGNTTNASSVTVGEALVPTDATGGTFGTCGSGTFELAVQVQNISTQDDLNAIATAELAKRGGIPQYITFETDKAGLFVGQALSVNLPTIGVGGYLGAPIILMITEISATAEAQPLEYGSLFHWDVTAISNQDPGNWVTYFADLISMASNPQPVLQYEQATWVLAPSGSLNGGTVTTNPAYVSRTGLVVDLIVGAGTAPVNQNLTLTVKDATLGITLATATIPAGSTEQVVKAVPSSSQLYVYALDTLTIEATYSVTGPNPVAASNVTATLRWTM